MQNENFWRISSVGRGTAEWGYLQWEKERPNLKHLRPRRRGGHRREQQDSASCTKKNKGPHHYNKGPGGFFQISGMTQN